MSDAVLEARAITKRFPGVIALRDVSFKLRAGEVHALCGENGAGKSTLIKLLSGIHPHGSYEGELFINGTRAEFHSIKDAEHAGLAVIYQELALVEGMTVAENIFLGSEPTRFGFIDWSRVHREARALLEQFDVRIDPAARCARLGVGQKQLVEIVKALSKKSRILILDEPTAALAEHEVQTLLAIVRDLRRRGIACIYISHKLDEVFAIADRITVLRDGASIATHETARTTKAEIIREMVGRELGDLFPRRARVAAEEPGGFLRDLITHPEKTLALCTKGAQTIVNADALVDISPEYVALPREEQRILHPKLHPLARQARDRAFELLLSRAPAADEVIHFTAGGQASGKSTLFSNIEGIIYDSMLADCEQGIALIQLVLSSGRKVAVHYVYRPFDEAVAANISRYSATGRAPSVPRMADRHSAARMTLEALLERFPNDPPVTFQVAINRNGHVVEIATEQLRSEWPAQSVDDMISTGKAVLDAKLAGREIDKGLHAFLGPSPRGGQGEGSGSHPARERKGEGSEGKRHPAARADSRAVSAPALRVDGLSVADPHTGKLALQDISFSLAPGEVLGIGGLMGVGRTELLMHIFGAWGVRRSGRVELDGRELPPSRPATVLKRGLALVSEDRRRYGLILDKTIGFNLSLASLSSLTRGGFIDRSREFKRNDQAFRSLRVKAPGLEAIVGKLSGGNQQKVVLGKALMTEPRVIFLDEPTRGIDVGAKLEIYEIINQLTDAGKAVVLVSSELPELIGMSDRIVMLHAGRIGGEFRRGEATQEQLMGAALGQAKAHFV